MNYPIVLKIATLLIDLNYLFQMGSCSLLLKILIIKYLNNLKYKLKNSKKK